MFHPFERNALLLGFGSLLVSQFAMAQNTPGAPASPVLGAATPRKSVICATVGELGQPDPVLQKAIDHGDVLARAIEDARSTRLDVVRKATQGDAAARQQVSRDWYDCIAERQPISDEQKHTTVEWLGDAAKSGNKNAAYELGLMYAKGIGVSQSYGDAFHWYVLSDERLASASAAEQNATGLTAEQMERQLAYRETIRSLVPRDNLLFLTPLEYRKLWKESPATRVTFTGMFGFEDCSAHIDVQATPPLDQPHMDWVQQRLAKIVSGLTLTGIACKDSKGEPLRWRLPYTASKPAE